MARLTREQMKTALDRGVSPEQLRRFVEKGTTRDVDVRFRDLPGNILPSAGRAARDIGSVLAHPIQTAKGLGKVALGGIQKLIPGEQKSEQSFDAVIDFYKERYGSVDKAKEAFINDPVGVALDVSTLFTGGGAALAKLAPTASKAARIGTTVGKAGRTIDPLLQLTRGVGKVAQKATGGRKIAPFRKKVDVGIKEAATRRGIELPASAISESPSVRIIEAAAQKGLFGGAKIAERITKAAEDMVKIADDSIKSLGGKIDKSTLGENLFKGLQKYKEKYFEIKNELYQQALIPVRGGGGQKTIKIAGEDIKPAIDTLDSVLKEKAFAEEVIGGTIKAQKRMDGIRNGLKAEDLTARKLHAALKTLNEEIKLSADPVITGNQAIFAKVFAQMDEALTATLKRERPDLAEALEAANKFNKEGLQNMNSKFGSIIKREGQAGRFDKIASAVTSPSLSIDDIPRMFEVIGKENIPALQGAVFEEIINKAKGIGETFTPTGVTRELNKFGRSKVDAFFTPEQVSVLNDLEKLTKSLGKGAKIAEGSQTAFIGRIGVEMSAAFGAIFAGNPFIAVKILLSDIAFNKFVASKAGQKLLTEGFDLTGKVGKKIQEKAPVVGAAGRGLFQLREPQKQGEQQDNNLLNRLR